MGDIALLSKTMIEKYRSELDGVLSSDSHGLHNLIRVINTEHVKSTHNVLIIHRMST